jgi:hypothetical protein
MMVTKKSRFHFRLTDEQKAAYTEQAKKDGLKLSKWIVKTLEKEREFQESKRLQSPTTQPTGI